MANVTLKSKYIHLKGLYDDSRNWRDQNQYEGLWKRMVRLYKGKHYEGDADSDRAVVNAAFSTKNIIGPSIAVNNPKFTINARKPEAAAQAVVAEVVLNYIWRTYKYQREFRLAVDDMLTVGHGWLKVGYKATKAPEGHVVDKHDDQTDAENEGIDDRDESIEGNVESELYVPWDEDRPFCERVSFFDMFVDQTARHPKEMKWIAQRTKRLLKDVKVDKRYDKAAREAVTGKTHSAFDDSNRDGRDDSEIMGDTTGPQFVDIIEFYDLRRQEVSTFAADGGDKDGSFLIKPKKIPYPFGHPFVMLRDYEVVDHFYPMGELEAIETLQHELNATRTQMLNHRSKFARKYLYHSDSFDDTGLKALRSDVDNEMVPFDGDIHEMANSVIAMPVQGTPPDFYNQSDLIQSDIDRTSGVSDYMRGSQSQIRRTATEAAMIQDAQNARAADKLSHIEQALSEVGERMIALMQLYMTGEHVVRIVGMSQPTWVKFDMEYIQGQFDFEVEAGSTQPNNESFRQQQALSLVEAIGNLMSLGAQIDVNMVAQKVLRDFGIKDPGSYVQLAPPQDPAMGGQPQQPGMPPTPSQQAGPPQMMSGPEFSQQMPPPSEESPIAGIPPELVAQLQGKSGLNV